MVQNKKLAVILVALGLILCTFVHGEFFHNKDSEYRSRNRRLLNGISEKIEGDQSMINQNGMETEVAKRTKSAKRGFPPLIPIAQLTMSILQKVLDILGQISRKIAVGIGNDTPYTWQGRGVHFISGTSDQLLPASVSPGTALLYAGRKTLGPVATGIAGVLVYVIPDLDVSLAVMFSVPFDYNLYENWWNVKAIPGKITPSEELFNDMYYYDDPYKGDNKYYEKNLGYGLRMLEGAMTSAGEARLIMKIEKTK